MSTHRKLQEDVVCHFMENRLNATIPALLGKLVDDAAIAFPLVEPKHLAKTLAHALYEMQPAALERAIGEKSHLLMKGPRR